MGWWHRWTTTVIVSSQISPTLFSSIKDRPLTPFFDNAAPADERIGCWQSNYTGAGIGVALIEAGEHAS